MLMLTMEMNAERMLTNETIVCVQYASRTVLLVD
jgi:hypothetical protein